MAQTVRLMYESHERLAPTTLADAMIFLERNAQPKDFLATRAETHNKKFKYILIDIGIAFYLISFFGFQFHLLRLDFST